MKALSDAPLACAVIRLIVCAFAAAVGTSSAQAQTASPSLGHQLYATRCASCHGTTAEGGEFAPAITDRVPMRSDAALTILLHDGLPGLGMPAFPDIVDPARAELLRFLRTLKPRRGLAAVPVSVLLDTGATLHGVGVNRAAHDMQILGEDEKIHLLRKTPDERYREVTSQVDWTGYDGPSGGVHTGSSRYSTLDEINAGNAAHLQPQWIFSLRNLRPTESTPVVVGGLMYVTSADECFALDAGNGRLVWHYQRARTNGVAGISATGVNRGVAVAHGLVFMTTDNAHLIALNAATGSLVWDREMGDWRDNYNGTGAPLVVNDMVLSGIAGGDEGARGFIAAFDQASGKELWRFWSVPKPGELGSQTWKGSGIEHPGGATWMTGTYDAELDTVYWPIGNPGDDLIGDDRPGDNLYTDSVVALDPRTGKLKWYFQFTPHDVHDFDAAEPLGLIDTQWQGMPRKLLVQANRNGFLYVLDRTNGRFLLGRAYTPKLTWATGLDARGRPMLVPGKEATREGTLVCPWLNGASNWYSSAYSPLTGLYYAQTDDKCGIFTREDTPFQQGHSYMGGSFSGDPLDPGQRILRAFDIHTGKAVWELPETGAGDTFGGVLATAGGVVFYAADDGAFAAADAQTGKPLWSFQTNQPPRASPMTYVFDQRQYIAIGSGPNIIAFGLPTATAAP